MQQSNGTDIFSLADAQIDDTKKIKLNITKKWYLCLLPDITTECAYIRNTNTTLRWYQ